MHTQSSQTYRKHCMPGHTQQCFAAMMTMRYLMARFEAPAIRHHDRVILALKRMEGSV